MKDFVEAPLEHHDSPSRETEGNDIHADGFAPIIGIWCLSITPATHPVFFRMNQLLHRTYLQECSSVLRYGSLR